MELVVFGLFIVVLLACVILGSSTLIALILGFVIFFSYGLLKKFTVKEMIDMSMEGVKTVKMILFTFLLIGMLTALWRAAGTIPVIISYTSWMIQPSIFLMVSFLLNCLISFLTGTSFGTAATMGVISMTIAATMKMDPLLAGGSVVSGIFFGDRCSPVSTSAQLVCTVTNTDIYRNIRRMFKFGAVPFVLTCGIYWIIGRMTSHGGASVDVTSLFEKGFQLHWVALLPAGIIVVMSIFRVNVRATMAVSIVTACMVGFFIQDLSILELGKTMLWGYEAKAPELAAMLNGGGMFSMVKVGLVVCISSSYSGIFNGTKMLEQIREQIANLGNYMPNFAGILILSIFTCVISCNQTLAIMLTQQLGDKLEPNEEEMAIDLEDSAALISALIPWSVAGAAPVATIGAPISCLLAACYLYLVPACHLVYSYIRKTK